MSDSSLDILQPVGWKRGKGYAHGLVGQGRYIFVSGQIGWDADEQFAEGLVGQTRQALTNILAILAEAGAGPQHIARLTWYVTDLPSYRANSKALGAMWREVMGRHFPVMAVVGVTGLVEEAACVEIEATAIIP